jgi:hypothetical protein
MPKKLTIRDRIVELRRVPAAKLLANPRNWRTHPQAQAEAMLGVLREIGYADALLARETPEGLELIDGNLRQKLTPDQKVPVLVLDVDEDEANKILATFDPLAAMAQSDRDKLSELLKGIETNDAALQEMLMGLARQNQLYSTEGDDPISLWQGMPEFNQENKKPIQSIWIHFQTREDVDAFAKLINQSINPKTHYLWFPYREWERTIDRRYASDTDES